MTLSFAESHEKNECWAFTRSSLFLPQSDEEFIANFKRFEQGLRERTLAAKTIGYGRRLASVPAEDDGGCDDLDFEEHGCELIPAVRGSGEETTQLTDSECDNFTTMGDDKSLGRMNEGSSTTAANRLMDLLGSNTGNFKDLCAVTSTLAPPATRPAVASVTVSTSTSTAVSAQAPPNPAKSSGGPRAQRVRMSSYESESAPPSPRARDAPVAASISKNAGLSAPRTALILSSNDVELDLQVRVMCDEVGAHLSS